jgi:hypothetical protein
MSNMIFTKGELVKSSIKFLDIDINTVGIVMEDYKRRNTSAYIKVIWIRPDLKYVIMSVPRHKIKKI